MTKDLGYIIGVVGGVLVVLWSIMIAGNLLAFIDFASIVVVCIGSSFAVVVSSDWINIKKIPTLIMIAGTRQDYDYHLMIRNLVSIADKVRKEGILSLDAVIPTVQEPILRQGLQMVVDGIETKIIDNILTSNLQSLESRHQASAGVIEYWGELAPAFGMIGTLIGLIIMLGNLSDPSSIGPSMAVAIITTFYGALMANLVLVPTAKRLSEKTAEEVQFKSIVVQGLLMLGDGFHPKLIEEKLLSFLAEKEREKYHASENEEI